jgi:hypothetical protein
MGSFSVNTSNRAPCASSLADSPFPLKVDRALIGMIDLIQNLYRDGKRTFAILTHDHPDPDAAAGVLGMKHLLQLVLPSNIQVRCMSIGHIGQEYSQDGLFTPEAIEGILPLYSSAANARQSALVLVDQPTIRCERVLPKTILSNGGPFFPHEADVVLDHHNGAQIGSCGVVSVEEAGSTSALILRALQLATERLGLNPRECDWYKDANFALFMNTGAWTDACIPLSTWENPGDLPEIVKWVHEQTKDLFNGSRVKDFDLSPCFDQFRRYANETRTVCASIMIDDKPCNVVMAFVGLVRNPNQLGAFASEYIREQVELLPRDVPLALAVFGVVRESDGSLERVLSNEHVRVSIRRHGDVCSDRIGKLISEESGGRDAGAVADLSVPLGLHAQGKDTFVGCCLRYLEAKLKGNASLDWEKDPFIDLKPRK